MARSLLVAPAAEDVRLARTCLGLLRALDRRGINVAFVKPVAQPRADGGPDRSAALVAAVNDAAAPGAARAPPSLSGSSARAGSMASWRRSSAAWEPIYAGSDVVVVEGLSSGPSKLYASSLNQALARALDADVLLVGGWPRRCRRRPGARSRAWPSSSPSRPADTPRASRRGWSAAWSTACPRRIPPRPPGCGRVLATSRSPPHRRGAAPAGADLAAGAATWSAS